MVIVIVFAAALMVLQWESVAVAEISQERSLHELVWRLDVGELEKRLKREVDREGREYQLKYSVRVSENRSLPIGTSLFHILARTDGRTSEKAIRQLQVFRLLLLYGNPIDLEDAYGQTPLLLAAKSSNVALARMLFVCGARLDTATSSRPSLSVGKRSVLHVVTLCGDAELLKTLLPYVSNVSPQNGLRETPILHAVEAQNADCAQLLIDAGAIEACTISQTKKILKRLTHLAAIEELSNRPSHWTKMLQQATTRKHKEVEHKSVPAQPSIPIHK